MAPESHSPLPQSAMFIEISSGTHHDYDGLYTVTNQLTKQSCGRLLPIFAGVFAAVLVLVPSMSSKFIAIGPVTIVGSTLIFPITFIFNDVLTEVYGYRQSRTIIWTGMAMQMFAAFFYWIIDIWPAPSFWHNQAAYSTILGQAPRIVLASLTVKSFLSCKKPEG
ncbi:hypothetical protein MELA_02697 [Candidatus Methylomirabilis lanthanidiphila]|uniref:Uncharacterized protein n=1 Tax=Candidatus Methylomirabilis lanthanidiphila TaxID=2211376 RepID=A0A564ZMH6_9BACT|nr:VUT family protein [Candidatus Methylomirabilis lanthanidiphila]VUZ86296.1 hypothetical protein MELA_02697 [Candidatus Methylomirabilis lanthanidiphila]